MGYYSEEDIEENESGRWQQKQEEEMEFAEYIYQLRQDDELMEKINEQLRSAGHERI